MSWSYNAYMCFEVCRCYLRNCAENAFTWLLLKSQDAVAPQDNDITGLGLSQATSYAEICVVEYFLLNRVPVISDVTSAAAMDYCKYWNRNQVACLKKRRGVLYFF